MKIEDVYEIMDLIGTYGYERAQHMHNGRKYHADAASTARRSIEQKLNQLRAQSEKDEERARLMFDVVHYADGMVGVLRLSAPGKADALHERIKTLADFEKANGYDTGTRIP